ncbi:bifunctional aldolase/short-chain dehydrogenase [Aureibacillus halotolerans]|uniref:Rhamnulose-1-phosphate aldolase/alcohol dehydrogenase n=1 Tax=Aureibacillus halotolerans TaxID=1508390 RepID=A0A4R6U1Q5_9BACI|nr:bifunctional aldolase/short-chain dehydrogenase [Aureibacillus halotolerans]TDQ38275.1 rhamnulose-1-phosphate aldolase/alcohol dehydrogenase [Aureibacillus halotolerans]
MVQHAWEAKQAPVTVGLKELVYRSNILGQDRSVANWGGGNTSMKMVEKDFRGRDVNVMYVKGSGSDLATMGESHFTGLRIDDIAPLKDRDEMTDEDMVAYLSHCMVNSAHPRASIETLLHAFLPYPHVDHTHPDAIISICCAENGQELAEKIYGNRFVWVPYIRPGFTLSKLIAEAVEGNPNAECVLMEKHGLVTWGETSSECYDKTIAIIQEAEAFLNERAQASPFGGEKHHALSVERRRDVVAEVLPAIRREVSERQQMLLTFDDSEDVLTFVNSHEGPTLSQVGAACPDHLVHTKRTPLWVPWDPQSGTIEELKNLLVAGIQEYKAEYQSYFERNRTEGDMLVDDAPRVVLIPGVGMVNTGKSTQHANISASLYHRAIAVMEKTTTVSSFVSLNENESYRVEYWPLELYKLSLAPPEAEFSRKIAFVTGGAGGIGSATCQALLEQGAHVILADLNEDGAKEKAAEFNETYGEHRALAVKMDVTSEEQVKAALKETVLTYGGVDLLVNNAGLATSSPFEETELSEWNINVNVLTTGYFLVARESYKLMKEQALQGSIVFVGSKNSVYAGKNVTAYSTAKAAEIHLARCIAAEGGEHGIRVNSVLPDAVLQGSAIWGSKWREERAQSYGIAPDELEEHYRNRTILKVNIYPSDIANAIAFLASSKAAKTTGCMLTVDGGVPAAFTR